MSWTASSVSLRLCGAGPLLLPHLVAVSWIADLLLPAAAAASAPLFAAAPADADADAAAAAGLLLAVVRVSAPLHLLPSAPAGGSTQAHDCTPPERCATK